MNAFFLTSQVFLIVYQSVALCTIDTQTHKSSCLRNFNHKPTWSITSFPAQTLWASPHKMRLSSCKSLLHVYWSGSFIPVNAREQVLPLLPPPPLAFKDQARFWTALESQWLEIHPHSLASSPSRHVQQAWLTWKILCQSFRIPSLRQPTNPLTTAPLASGVTVRSQKFQKQRRWIWEWNPLVHFQSFAKYLCKQFVGWWCLSQVF